MPKLIKTLFTIITLSALTLSPLHADDTNIQVDLSGFSASSGTAITQKDNVLTAAWKSGEKVISVSFRVAYTVRGQGRRLQDPLIKSIGVTENNQTSEIFKDLQPEYAVFLGKRDLKKRDGWQVFFD
jgi:hypothetical protein